MGKRLHPRLVMKNVSKIISMSGKSYDFRFLCVMEIIEFVGFEDKKHYTLSYLRCIEFLYGEHGLDVVELLHKNLVLALQVISRRLIWKSEELKMCLSNFDKVCHRVHAKNQFKLQDKQFEEKV